MIIDANVVPYLIKFVTDSEEHFFETALDILTKIIGGSEDQKQAVLDYQMSAFLKDILRNLSSPEKIRKHFKSVVDADFIHLLCEKLNEFLGPSDRSVSTLII